MHFHRKSKLAVCALAAAGLGLVSAASHAGRSVRVDASDSAFESLGGFWGSDNEQFGGPSFAVGKTEFKLKLSPKGAARFYNVCMGEGFIKFISINVACKDADFTGPPTDSYIAVFATDFDDSSGRYVRTRGFVDTKAPYKLQQTAIAMRFGWNGVSLAGDATFSTFNVQIVLIDRSNGKNNGNFDIEFNYGLGGDQVPPVPNTDGFQGFSLGPNHVGPTFGPFGPFDSDGAPIRYCFRAGKKKACT